MGFFSKLFGKKESEVKVGGMEDFMTLIRVYFEASLAVNLGINNLGMLPDLRTFKTTLRVPTLNNKLGLSEKNQCRKMMREMYGLGDDFFKIKACGKTVGKYRMYSLIWFSSRAFLKT